MKININEFILSQPLEMHPVRYEKADYKIKYLSVLNYFVTKYSSNDKIAKAMLENYKLVFMNEDIIEISLEAEKFKSCIKQVMAKKINFKGFRIFTYRYCLLCDVFAMNAFNDRKTAEAILSEIKLLFNKRNNDKLEQLFSILYENTGNTSSFDLAEYQINCWRQNRKFIAKPEMRILITANMSAGKSTLINALIGKQVNKTMNDVCTSKIHYTYDKAFEDNYTHKWDYEVTFNANHKELIIDNELNSNGEIFASTHFHMLADRNYRLSIIDTPGVNSSMNKEHGKLTETNICSGNYDVLVYVINAENAGTDDDIKYLTYIRENVGKNKIVFVLNKLDHFRKSEDSVADSIESLKRDLHSIGFGSPVICPISSYAGVLAKKKMRCESMNEDEIDEYEMLKKKFNKPEYDLSHFYKKTNFGEVVQERDENMQLLIKSGIYGLEQIILQGVDYNEGSFYKV